MNNKSTNKVTEFDRMTRTPVPRLITAMSVPTVISMLITAVYNMADTFFVAKLGASASGATGVVFALMVVIQAVGFMVGMGAGSKISRLLGEKKNEQANVIGSSALLAALVFGAVITAVGLPLLTPLMRLLGATDTILPYAQDYALYILIAAPLMTGSFVLNNLLRAEGRAVLSMVGIGIGGLINIALDPLFIFTLNMGIGGAALATALSQLVGFAILSSNYVRKRTLVNISVKNISGKPSVYGTILKNGSPSFARQGLASIATVALNNTAAIYGDSAVAAMTIVTRLFMFIFSVLIGLGQGYQPVAGYNYGARLYGRVKKAFYFMLGTGTAAMTGLGALFFFLAPTLMTWFIPDDPSVIEIGITALRAQCLAMPLLCFGVTCNMTFQAVGKSGISTFTSSCRQGIFFLPLILILPGAFGLFGLQITQPVSDALTFIVCVPFVVRFIRALPSEHRELEDS